MLKSMLIMARANPAVLGELKVTGYSDYMHMYDKTT